VKKTLNSYLETATASKEKKRINNNSPFKFLRVESK